ncbi:hypothetical protein BV25DRAFT_1830147 [Artomyces pyxidatus]|uniref:Uncharacterized protein n=1 Tax=Artomyces pyxidatus TaxID=48021 RepID=A0ACB8SQK6_9AGAM|nr:hypothetical protein BV25DRAFT_1830147 [Artomyces pyxidatus]
MSFLLGPLSGALVAGGVYYGFSNLIQTRTEQHREDLHTLSQRLITPPSTHPAPPPASARIVRAPFSTFVKQSWNEKISGLYEGVRREGSRASSWGRRVLYGGEATERANNS